MQFKLPADLSKFWCRSCVSFLAFSWALGLSVGLILVSTVQESVFSLMRAAACCRVSIVGLIVLLIFPLFLSAFAVFLSIPVMLLPIACFKGIALAFCALGVVYAFGSAGWLIRMLLMFSDSFMIPVLFWFWVRHISGNRNLLRRDFLICAAFAVVIGAMEYFLVSPYLVVLMKHF